MATQQEIDASPASGQPVFCYMFESTSWGDPIYYTNAEENIVLHINGVDRTFIVCPGIEHGSITYTANLDNPMTCEITLRALDPVAQMCCFTQIVKNVIVTIFRKHRQETGHIVELVGEMVGRGGGSGKGVIKLGSLIASHLSGNLRIPIVQRFCNFTFCDPLCGLNIAAFTTNRSVVRIDNAFVDVAAGAVLGRFVRGKARLARTGETHNIVQHVASPTGVGHRINVVYPFNDLVVGDVLEITEGCDHLRLGDCKRLNNTARYGGMDFVPETDILAEINTEVSVFTMEWTKGYTQKEVIDPPPPEEDEWTSWTVSST